MARLRRTSNDVTKAGQRLIGLAGIAANLDLGDGVSVATLTAERDATQTLLDRYNALLSEVDAVGNQLQTAEKSLRTLNSRVLTLVRGRYGADSSEYERVGGVRQSEKKKPTRRTPAASGAPTT